jgi:glycosyltransferase involved in cell wall biosynthesis
MVRSATPTLTPVSHSNPPAAASPVRLAVVSDAVLPWHHGGKEQRHHELYTRLAARGFVVTVYTMHWWAGPRRVVHGDVTYVALCRNLPLYRGARRSILQAVVFALACTRLLWQRFDVVEADAIPFLPLVPVRVVCWLRRRPMVTTWHEFWGRDYWLGYLHGLRGAEGRLAAWVEEAVVRLPDRIVACSQETAGRLERTRHGPRDVVVVPNGVDLSGAPRTGAPRPDDGPARLLVAGRLLDNKRVDLGLRAVRVLLDRGADVTFDVVGDGPERPSLVALSEELGLGEHVTFTGFLPSHDDVLDRMADADVLLFTSTREGFGMVALEAMSVGTPVVTADHPDNAARHLVRDGVNGYVAQVSAEGFADAVEATLGDLDKLRDGARSTAAAYDWETLVDDVATAYRTALDPVRVEGAF